MFMVPPLGWASHCRQDRCGSRQQVDGARGSQVQAWHRPGVIGRLEANVTSSGRAPVFLTLFVLAFAGSAWEARAQAPPGPALTLTLPDAVARALANNPAYLAKSLDLGLATLDIDIAGERPNPDFAYENTRDAPHQAFVFTTPVELGGKRGSRVALGQSAREVVRADLAREAADLRSDVRHAFYRLMAADRRLAVARELMGVAARARDAARTRVESGDAPRLDQVQAELAGARVANATATAEGERAALQDELDALLGLPPGTALTPVGDVFVDGLDTLSAPAAPAGESIDVTAAMRRTAAANAAIGLARSARVPDVTVETGLTYDAPPDFAYGWKLGASMTVPLFTTHRVEVVRAQQAATQAERQQAAATADVASRLSAASRRAMAFGEAVRRTTRDILPAAATVNDMAQASYEAGQTGMVNLLQSLQTVAETRLDAVETALSFQLALADLERVRAGAQP
jgi:cobalt-zinc-cadmium efflux system outer membrane protein